MPLIRAVLLPLVVLLASFKAWDNIIKAWAVMSSQLKPSHDFISAKTLLSSGLLRL